MFLKSPLYVLLYEEQKQLSLTDDRIEKAIRQNNARFMIVGSIQAYLGANVDRYMNRANETVPYSDISV